MDSSGSLTLSAPH